MFFPDELDAMSNSQSDAFVFRRFDDSFTYVSNYHVEINWYVKKAFKRQTAVSQFEFSWFIEYSMREMEIHGLPFIWAYYSNIKSRKRETDKKERKSWNDTFFLFFLSVFDFTFHNETKRTKNAPSKTNKIPKQVKQLL